MSFRQFVSRLLLLVVTCIFGLVFAFVSVDRPSAFYRHYASQSVKPPVEAVVAALSCRKLICFISPNERPLKFELLAAQGSRFGRFEWAFVQGCA